MRTSTLSPIFCASLSLLAAACGGGGGSDDVDAAVHFDGAPRADARPGSADASVRIDAVAATIDAALGEIDAGVASGCEVPASYGALGTRTDPVEADSVDTPTMMWATIDLNGDPDVLFVDLYAGVGVFGTGLATGSYPLTGAELQYATCGACVRLHGVGTGGGDPLDYMATGGTLEITALTPNLEATLTNVTFEHVTMSGSDSTPVGDGCETTIGSLSFDSPLSVSKR